MKPTLLIVLFLACITAGVLSYQVLTADKNPDQDIKAAYLKGGDFTLQGRSGTVSLSEYRGQPVILYFGFASCPDVCPLGLTVIRDALKSDDRFANVPALFVTLDPERDTLERLDEYLAFFHPNLQGLTGSLEALKAVAGQYGTYFMKTDPDADGNYSVDHTAYFYLIDRDGELVRVLDHNTSQQGLATALEKLL